MGTPRFPGGPPPWCKRSSSESNPSKSQVSARMKYVRPASRPSVRLRRRPPLRTRACLRARARGRPSCRPHPVRRASSCSGRLRRRARAPPTDRNAPPAPGGALRPPQLPALVPADHGRRAAEDARGVRGGRRAAGAAGRRRGEGTARWARVGRPRRCRRSVDTHMFICNCIISLCIYIYIYIYIHTYTLIFIMLQVAPRPWRSSPRSPRPRRRPRTTSAMSSTPRSPGVGDSDSNETVIVTVTVTVLVTVIVIVIVRLRRQHGRFSYFRSAEPQIEGLQAPYPKC